MSRIGKKPIAVPAGVEVKIDGHTVTVKGPKGTLSRKLNPAIDVKVEDGQAVSYTHLTLPTKLEV